MENGNIKLIIFDVDGTLTTTQSGATFRKSADDWQWLPGRLKKLHELKGQGVELAVATNQGGVAFGYMEEGDVQTQLSLMCNQGGITYLWVCYAHPKASVEGYAEKIDLFDRKPSPGMLLKAMLKARVSAQETFMVGDRPEDEQAARNAGVAFQQADAFFS